MAESQSVVVLPHLVPKGPFKPVPRRYEDTKPSLVQNFTHRRILDLGNSFHQATLKQADDERLQAVREAENRTWAEAEEVKKDALDKALAKAQAKHELAIKKLVKAHEKTLKETTVRLTSEMSRQQMEAVQAEREAGQQRLEEAVNQTLTRCEQERLDAVAQARQEEQDAAAQAATLEAQRQQERFDAAMAAAAEAKAQALSAQKFKMDREREMAVAAAHAQEQQFAYNKRVELQAVYEKRISGLQEHIRQQQEKITRLQQEIAWTQERKKEVGEELLETREEFQKFINKTNPFEPGKADYMIPPLRSIPVKSYTM